MSSNENKQVTQICDEFAASWQSDTRPDIARFIERAEPTNHAELLERLVLIDIEYRRKVNQEVPYDYYHQLGFIGGKESPDPNIDSPTVTFTDDPLAVEPPPDVIGPYKILQVIGHGGMGQVYMAEQTEPVRRRVALKVIKTDSPTKEVLARFEAERQALAMMDHQNIAKVLDSGSTERGLPYFAMELVRGIPINEYADKNKLSVKDRLELFLQVCRAIQHAHQKGIIHRDLKPSNILVALYDGKPIAKVIDFGLAKALQEQVQLTNRTLFTVYGQVVGTLAYMSPEQAEFNSLDVDTRTDVYSLGVVLYELLTGSTPITRETIRKEAFDRVLALIREQDAPRPSVRLSDSGEAITGLSDQRRIPPRRLSLLLKGDLDWIAMKSLEKDRARRYEGAAQLADDIERFLNGDAISARPPSVRYQLTKTMRRHRKAFLVATAFVILLLGGLATTTFLYFRARRLAEDNHNLATAMAAEASKAQAAEEKATADRDRAEKAESQALREASISEAVTRFLTNDLFVTEDLRRQPDLTLKSALQRSTARIDDRFSSQREAGIEIRRTVGQLFYSLGDYQTATPILQRALVELTAIGKNSDEAYLRTLSEFGISCTKTARFIEAEKAIVSATQLATELYGHKSRKNAACLIDLAQLHRTTGNFLEAEEVLEQANAALDESDVDTGPLTVRLTLEQAELFQEIGDYPEAESVLKLAVSQIKETSGEDSLAYADALEKLCSIYLAVEHVPPVSDLISTILEIRRRKLGDHHLSVASANLLKAREHCLNGDLDKASGLLDTADSIIAVTSGNQSPLVVTQLNLRAEIAKKKLNLEQGETFLLEAVSICENTTVGNELLAKSLLQQGELYLDASRPALAEKSFAGAASVALDLLAKSAPAQSQRQQQLYSQKLKPYIDAYTRLAMKNPGYVDRAFRFSAEWRGMAYRRQLALRALQQDPSLRDLFARQRMLTEQLSDSRSVASTELTSGKMNVTSETVQQLRRELEGIEKDISRKLPAQLETTLLDHEMIPDHVSFVAFFDLPEQVVAFVVSKSNGTRLIPLASAERVLTTIADYTNGLDTKKILAANNLLGEMLWAPLESQLKGADAVILCPSPTTVDVRFASLRLNDQFLVEKHYLSQMPTPGAFFDVLKKKPSQTANSAPSRKFLVVGAPDYNLGTDGPDTENRLSIGTTRSVSSEGEGPKWVETPGMRTEISVVSDSFKQRYGIAPIVLQGDEATEAKLSNAMVECSGLHLSTHGFRAGILHSTTPAAWKKPYLEQELFGLVLAGANRGNVAFELGGNDGYLWEDEIALFPLSKAEIVVVAACESYGLQQSLLASGARSTITIQGLVDDRACAFIVSNFYDNLWNKGMSKMESLRQAQLKLIKNINGIESGNTRGLGKVRRVKIKVDSDRKEEGIEVLPIGWGGFVLAGDWR